MIEANTLALEPWMYAWLSENNFDHLDPPNWIFYLSEEDRREWLTAAKRGFDHAEEMSRLAND